MPATIVTCDDAAVPARLSRAARRLHIRSTGNLARLTLRVQPISDPLVGTVSGRAEDLVRIAAYVYWADQLVGRGGRADVAGDSWRRAFTMYVPVSDPDFWGSPEVHTLLQDALGFASEDFWNFHFSKGVPLDKQLTLGESAMRSNLPMPDSVALFSGGADSLCALVEAAMVLGRRPALVSHWPVTIADARQRNLHEHLRRRYQAWDFPRISVLVNKAKVHERDSSQRSRSFLFAALGSATAATLHIEDVILADNGVVSLNLPINDQLLGALATRSTHPRFIWLFNRLLRCVFTDGPQLRNPLRYRTRAEVLDVLKLAGVPELLQESNSCSRSRGRPNVTPHCGACSQCVDRRFAGVAAGLEDHDLAERYRTDMFRASLAGDDLTTVESYVRFVQKVKGLSDDEFLYEFPQLHDCIVDDDPNPEATVLEYIAMLRRHATTTLEVVEQAIVNARSGLALGRLPPTCLLRIAIAAAPSLPDPVVPSVFLTPAEEREFEQHRFHSRIPIQVRGQTAGRKSNVVWIGDREVILPDSEFRLFLRLVVAFYEVADGFVPLGTMKRGGGLVDEGIFEAEGIHQAISRLRWRLNPALGDLTAKRFVEVQRKRVRLSTHRRYVSFDRPGLVRHPDKKVSAIAERLPGKRGRRGSS